MHDAQNIIEKLHFDIPVIERGRSNTGVWKIHKNSILIA